MMMGKAAVCVVVWSVRMSEMHDGPIFEIVTIDMLNESNYLNEAIRVLGYMH
jgi:hypothetical protein